MLFCQEKIIFKNTSKNRQNLQNRSPNMLVTHPNTGIARIQYYGFNGMEKDDEVKGRGDSYTTEFRQYDPRLGRWLSLDPRKTKYPDISPYVAYANNPMIYIDVDGDTIKFVGMNDSEIEEYNSAISFFKSSDLFKCYYEALEKSNNIYYVSLDKEINFGGKYDNNTKTVTLGSFKATMIVQEWFHAFQRELDVFSSKDHSVMETEGDLMTEYVLNELNVGFGAMISEQGDPGGWAESVLEINGTRDNNPTNEQVQSEKYNNLFNQAVDKRIEHFKTKGKAYESYTRPNSGLNPKAIQEVFKKVKELRK